MEIPFDGEATGSTDFFHFGEGEVAPFFFVADYVSEEQELSFVLRALCGKPSPVVPRAKKLGVDGGVRGFLLFIERG